MSNALSSAYESIRENDSLQLLILTATGKVFSVDKIGNSSGDSAKQLSTLAIPVLVALNGDATGSGLELALAGDLRVCVPSAKFSFPGLERGAMPKDGGT